MQPEARLSRTIIHHIRACGGFAFKLHGGPTQMAGLPDIAGVWNGLSIWIEAKMPGNKPTPVQLHRHDELRAAGAYVLVAYSLDQVREWMDSIGPRNSQCDDCR